MEKDGSVCFAVFAKGVGKGEDGGNGVAALEAGSRVECGLTTAFFPASLTSFIYGLWSGRVIVLTDTRL